MKSFSEIWSGFLKGIAVFRSFMIRDTLKSLYSTRKWHQAMRCQFIL